MGITAGQSTQVSITPAALEPPADLATGKPISASTVSHSEYAPENAVDEELPTRWSSESKDNQWIQVDPGLNDLPRVKLTAKASAHITAGGETATIIVDLVNRQNTAALMTFLPLRNASDNSRILLAYSTNNYISLLPGEKCTVAIQASTAKLFSGTQTGHGDLSGGMEYRA
ncbi:MAG: hypothetical protein ACAI35_13165 [Candidatus Methylacidiphilales bacterium]|nr:hypothetical protein [Candidatus Methylacidiphilales bacterium]